MRIFITLVKTRGAEFIFYFLFFIFYLCLLYTKSRSGFAGLWFSLIVFSLTIIFYQLKIRGSIIQSQKSPKSTQNQATALFCVNQFRPIILAFLMFGVLTFLEGTPFPQLNRFTARQLVGTKTPLITQPVGPALETGGTESGEIRKIVWKGAWEIARHYPLFGSGVETFAYSYYQFKPREHNLVSEWDFLYNKAHNEYLNFAATTGFVGLGSYLLLIGWFIVWNLSKLKNENENIKTTMKKSKNFDILQSSFSFFIFSFSLLAAYISILITNFFGFSVVPVALYFWLIPAMSQANPLPMWNRSYTLGIWQKVMTAGVLFFIFSFLFFILKLWYADTRFNRAYQLARSGYYKEAYPPYHQAINLNPGEPFYRDELAYTAAVLAVAAFEQKEASLAGQLANEAILQNKIALTTSPANVNFWKTRTKVFYTLATIDERYNEEALESLLTAQKLAPTDAKIAYNLGLLYGRVGNSQMAIKTLEDTLALKPNYQDARFALALYYDEAGRRQEAIDQLKYILEKISSGAAEAKEKLKEWQ